jgi:hypothetical protein
MHMGGEVTMSTVTSQSCAASAFNASGWGEEEEEEEEEQEQEEQQQQQEEEGEQEEEKEEGAEKEGGAKKRSKALAVQGVQATNLLRSSRYRVDVRDRVGSKGVGGEGDLSLLSCVVFPRAVDEQGNARETFGTALNVATTHALATQGPSTCSSSPAGYCVSVHKTVRVVTHALGAFTGHSDPPLFAKSMAQGLLSFLGSEAGMTYRHAAHLGAAAQKHAVGY